MPGVNIQAEQVTMNGDVAGRDIAKSDNAWVPILLELFEELGKESADEGTIEKKTVNVLRAIPDGLQVAMTAILQGPLAAVGLAVDKIVDMASTGGN